MPRLVLLALLLASATPVGAAPGEATWTYDVRFADDLSKATVRMHFRAMRPRRLVLMRNDALRALTFAPGPDGRAPYDPNPRRDGIAPRLARDGSLAYAVDFRTLSTVTARQDQSKFVGRDLVTRPGLFLLQPSPWPANARVEVVLRLPAGMRAAVPWTRDIVASNKRGRTVYRIEPHALVSHARVAFGRFHSKRVEVEGGALSYHVLDAPHRVTDQGLQAWLATAMRCVAGLFGRPPVPHADVIVQPLVPGRGRPIVFGRATLSGGPLLHVMLSGTTTDAEMPGEWITIHEMIHLGMPVTSLADRWFGEGFVSYYQEVLRARAGILSPRAAWQNLHNWMKRGRASGGKRTLAEESRLMTNAYAYHRVYWGGAALALLMDVRIRVDTDGARSLDDVMRHFLAHHVTPGRVIGAMDLMRHADALLDRSICVPIAQRALGSRAFPDLRGTYEQLGLQVVDGRVSLRSGARYATVRDAIMRAGGH